MALVSLLVLLAVVLQLRPAASLGIPFGDFARNHSRLSSEAVVLDAEDIQRVLPHRFPFLFVDSVLSLDPRSAVGVKVVSFNEHFFQGHFPQKAIMPGVLQVEALAQLAGIVCLNKENNKNNNKDNNGRLFLFAGVDGVKWRRPVLPGDVLVMEVEALSSSNSRVIKFEGRGYVAGKLTVEVKTMTFMLSSL